MCALKFYFANKLLKKSKLVEVQMPKVAQKLPSTIRTGERRGGRGGGGGGEREYFYYWVLEVSSLSGGIHVGFLSIWRSLMVNNSLSNGLEEKVCKV